MAEYTKAQILQLIADNLPDNITKAILPDHLREVVIKLTDMLQGAEFISYTHGFRSLLANVKQALDDLIECNIPTWIDTDWPDNYTVFHEGDLYHSNDIISEGEAAPDVSAKWDIVSGTGGTTMTAEQIAAALNTITVLANMVSSNRVKYSVSLTVQQKIDAMDVVITGKQGEIFSKRIIIEGEISGVSLVIAGYIHPFQLAVNRVPYVGKEGASFAGELAGFDFRYAHANNVTTITSNPAFTPRLSFNPGDVIDILHSNAALKAEAE